MDAFIRYILISTICLSVLYSGYLFFQKKETRFQQLRYFLLISIVLSVLMPFSTFRINLDLSSNKYDIEKIHHKTDNTIAQTDELTINHVTKNFENDKNWSVVSLLTIIYFLVLSFFGLCLLIHLFKVLHVFSISEKIKHNETTIYSNNKIDRPFTFFTWIFIPDNYLKDNENKDILTHERIHVLQYHSIDLILIELLSAVMWFNPLVWMMKKSVQSVHEYLADEGVLNTGIDKLRYQALLINQVAEERLICLSSSFNHSLIKKRMIMMTKSKFNQGSKLRIFALIPLAIVLFVAIACINGQDKSNIVTAVEPVRMNVLYIGVDNPIKIAASGYDASDLTVSVDNGTISGKNGEYIIRPKQPGSAIVTVISNGKEIQKTTFRVKTVPDPEVKVAGLKGGNIAKSELLKEDEIIVEMDFDFDLTFDIVEFTVSTVINGNVEQIKSSSNSITAKQKDLISNAKIGNTIYFQEIKCKGPDGSLRNMPTILFKITE